jgi:hypothetical protein
VQYGELETFGQVDSEIFRFNFQTLDGRMLSPVLSFIDSGFKTKDVYDFCRGRPYVIPCKGASLADDPYRIVHLGYGASKAKRPAARGALGQPLVHINVDYWETEVQERLDKRRPGEPGSLTFCREAAGDRDLCEQMLNATLDDAETARGGAKLLWVKRDRDSPNDFRDTCRMALCAAKVYLDSRGGRLPAKASSGNAQKQRAVINPGDGRPDGRHWLS